MPILYNSQELIPCPLISVSRTYIRDEGNKKIRADYVFTLNGTIVNVDDSSDSPAAIGLQGMAAIQAEQQRIREIFEEDGKRLEVTAPNGGSPYNIDTYCIVEDISFNQGVWVNRCDYTIILKSPKIEEDTEIGENLNSKTESWNITENEDGTFSISHSLSAVGTIVYSGTGINDPLSDARTWCRNRSFIFSNGAISPVLNDTLDLTTLINPLGSDNTNFWNRGTVEGIGSVANSWQLAENFIYSPSGNYREDFSAQISYEPNDPRHVTITANGTITGLADRISDYHSRINNAKTKFLNGVEPNLYTRISSYVPNGYTTNPIPSTRQVSYDEVPGTIRYSHTFTAVSGNLIANTIDESFNVHDTGPTDVFAQIQVPGRANGPIVQYMHTSTLPERTVSYNATLTPSLSDLSIATLNSLYLSKPSTDALIDACKPSDGNYYIKSDEEEFNPLKRTYNRVVSWVIQPEGKLIPGIPSGVSNPSLI